MIPYVFIAGDVFRLPDVVHSPHDRFTVFIYVVMLGFFCFNYYFLLPRFYLQKKLLLYFTIIALILILLIAFYYWIDFRTPHFMHLIQPPPDHHPPPPPPFAMHGGHHPPPQKPPAMSQLSQLLFLYIIGILVSLFACINRNFKKIELERNKTALAYLKSQINPHFLFNTFNSIYGLAVKENADKTAGGMLKLSGILRYVLTDTHNDFVSLDKEMAYINNYIELQKLRITANTNFRYMVSGETENKKIAPMLMIPFIENAFKYGINPGVESDILISIDIGEDALQMKVRNRKIAERKSAEKMGIGIENTKTRLELLYPQKHKLQIIDTEMEYTVFLKINLS